MGMEEISIKWPNDVYVAGKKVCGILLEGNISEYIVIGIGINVNQTEFHDEYRIPPTSIRLELGKEVDIKGFRALLYKNLEEDLKDCLNKRRFISYYEGHDYLKGKKVEHLGDTCTVIGVDEDFALILEKDGVKEKVTSSEVTLKLV